MTSAAPLKRTIEAHLAALSPVRQEFIDWLQALEAEPDELFELEVVFSELMSNAMHAASHAHEHVGVHATLEGRELLLEVENPRGQASFALDVFGDLDDPLRGSGRGLVIVAAYVDDLSVLPPEAGKGLTVACRRTLRVRREHALG